MKFLIQTIEGGIRHDFSFALLESIRYFQWLNRDEIEFKLTDEEIYPNYIPVGSVEFVSGYFKKYYDIELKPINIPSSLMQDKFLKRKVFIGNEKDVKPGQFVKSNEKIKGYTNIIKEGDNIPHGNYLISDYIDITSEWRAFVYKGDLVGLQNYSGDFLKFPDVNLIKEMIQEYKDSPVSYTIDVGVNNYDTFLIEVHDFFSCGLYGFNNINILPFMFSRWFYEKLKKNGK